MGRSVKAVEQQRAFRRDSALSRLVLAGLALTVAGAVVGPGRAAVIGGARVVPFEQAVERSRVAAEAVVHRLGKETCLRGKLTNALLGLSASCEAGARGPAWIAVCTQRSSLPQRSKIDRQSCCIAASTVMSIGASVA